MLQIHHFHLKIFIQLFINSSESHKYVSHHQYILQTLFILPKNLPQKSTIFPWLFSFLPFLSPKNRNYSSPSKNRSHFSLFMILSISPLYSIRSPRLSITANQMCYNFYFHSISSPCLLIYQSKYSFLSHRSSPIAPIEINMEDTVLWAIITAIMVAILIFLFYMGVFSYADCYMWISRFSFFFSLRLNAHLNISHFLL